MVGILLSVSRDCGNLDENADDEDLIEPRGEHLLS
jgi:hypothetical protein